MRRSLAHTASTLALAATLAAAAPAAAEPVAAFDPARGEHPEGIVAEPGGGLVVSLAPLGEIRRRDARGAWSTVARIDPGSGGFAVLGVVAGPSGRLYVAAPTDAADRHGVVVIELDGTVRRYPGSEQMGFPNGLAFGPHGHLYVTDSRRGAIWRLRRGHPAELWLEHPQLAGTGALGNGFPLGANGIAAHGRHLYVANTEKKQVVAIPVRRSGAPGEPAVVHAYTGEADFLDGIVTDSRGRLYVLVAGASRLDRIDRCGAVTTLATAADGLSMPASLVFGTGRHGRTLLVTNLSLPGFVPAPMPGVVALGVPGR